MASFRAGGGPGRSGRRSGRTSRQSDSPRLAAGRSPPQGCNRTGLLPAMVPADPRSDRASLTRLFEQLRLLASRRCFPRARSGAGRRSDLFEAPAACSSGERVWMLLRQANRGGGDSRLRSCPNRWAGRSTQQAQALKRFEPISPHRHPSRQPLARAWPRRRMASGSRWNGPAATGMTSSGWPNRGSGAEQAQFHRSRCHRAVRSSTEV